MSFHLYGWFLTAAADSCEVFKVEMDFIRRKYYVSALNFSHHVQVQNFVIEESFMIHNFRESLKIQ